MDAVRLSRLTTGLVLAAGGLAAGHVLLPYTPPAAVGRRVLFWAFIAAMGAWRGWSEGGLLEEPPSRRRRRAAVYAFAAASLAYAANWLVHGGPHWP